MPKHVNGPSCESCNEKLKGAHPFIADWFLSRVKPAHPDAHIAHAYRNREEQEECVKLKTSTLHYPLSKHNHTKDGLPCSLALDLFRLNELKRAVWPPIWYADIAAKSMDTLKMRWGGTFKKKMPSGRLIDNPDGPHFEMLCDLD